MSLCKTPGALAEAATVADLSARALFTSTLPLLPLCPTTTGVLDSGRHEPIRTEYVSCLSTQRFSPPQLPSTPHPQPFCKARPGLYPLCSCLSLLPTHTHPLQVRCRVATYGTSRSTVHQQWDALHTFPAPACRPPAPLCSTAPARVPARRLDRLSCFWQR